MRRDVLERITASLVIILTTVFSVSLILVIANLIFEWDIFPPFFEKVLYFIMLSIVVIVMSSAVINIMLNLSRMAFHMERASKFLMRGHDHEDTHR